MNFDGASNSPAKARPRSDRHWLTLTAENRQQDCRAIINSLPSSIIPCARRKVSLPWCNEFPAPISQGNRRKPLKRQRHFAPESPDRGATTKISLPNSLPAGNPWTPSGPTTSAARAGLSRLVRPSAPRKRGKVKWRPHNVAEQAPAVSEPGAPGGRAWLLSSATG